MLKVGYIGLGFMLTSPSAAPAQSPRRIKFSRRSTLARNALNLQHLHYPVNRLRDRRERGRRVFKPTPTLQICRTAENADRS